jgi:hypothetical protein
MTMMLRSTTFAVAAMVTCAFATALPAHAQTEGNVQISLAQWQALTGSAGHTTPAASLGLAEASIGIEERDGRVVTTATVTLQVRAREAGAEALLLPPGTAFVSASVDGNAVALARGASGLSWVADTAGEHRVELRYELEGARFDTGASVAIPLPPAPSVHLRAILPPDAGEAAIVPGIGARTTRSGDTTVLDATIPGGAAAHLTWRALAASETAVPSRAVYRGRLAEGAVHFDVELAVDRTSDAPSPVALFPVAVALGNVTIDGEDAPIRVVGDHTAAIVRGRGRHVITARIEIPLAPDGGLPSALVPIPEVPVSRFELALPPHKDVRVEPAAAITRERRRGETFVVFHVPLTSEVRLEWPEALPDEASIEGEPEARASAMLVHVVRAEEGLLRGRVRAQWDVTRGSASQFELAVPTGVEVGAVTADAATVADWRVAGPRDRVLTVFLDRVVSGTLALSIDYEVLVRASTSTFEVPLLSARGVARQGGMVALLMTRELVMQPQAVDGLAHVGENQLPPEVRAEIDAPASHVFRWTDAPPQITATTTARPREAGRFDVRIDTLVSLGDVTTTASAAIDVRVKSGTLGELAIALPAGASLLDVSAPSLREHRIEDAGGHPLVRLFFTQEMDGELRVELRWERIASSGETDVAAPMAHALGADVEQGRIAIEATAAATVEARTAEGLSPIDLGELPEELVLRSSNPILLAFRYAHAAPAPTLDLSVARHAEVALRDAAIDSASYRTLVTDDGLAVTTATWTVRNQRQQFLRIALPEGAEMWSARVGGRAETPALASDAPSDHPVILVGVLRSLEPFEVEITYSTPISRVGLLGRVGLEMARPDVVATRARWEVYLPPGPRWGEPSSDIALRESGMLVATSMAATLDESANGLAIQVPAEGVRWVFEDVYVGRDGTAVTASFPYASGAGIAIGWVIGLLGALLSWMGLLGLVMSRAGFVMVPEGGPFELATYRFAAAAKTMSMSKKGVPLLVATMSTGVLFIVLSIVWLGMSPAGPIVTTLLVALGLLLSLRTRIVQHLRALRARIMPPAPSTSAAAETTPSEPST